MHFRCRTCGFHWGPVGLRPHAPGRAEQQLLLVCSSCKQPAALIAIPGQVAFCCGGCGASGFTGLSACPACDGTETDWSPS